MGMSWEEWMLWLSIGALMLVTIYLFWETMEVGVLAIGGISSIPLVVIVLSLGEENEQDWF